MVDLDSSLLAGRNFANSTTVRPILSTDACKMRFRSRSSISGNAISRLRVPESSLLARMRNAARDTARPSECATGLGAAPSTPRNTRIAIYSAQTCNPLFRLIRYKDNSGDRKCETQLLQNSYNQRNDKLLAYNSTRPALAGIY